MKQRLIFVHGWGFDATIWRGIAGRIGGYDCAFLDLGYFGAPFLPSYSLTNAILIGHSFGVLWLLRNVAEAKTTVSGFAAINGFAKFTAASDNPPGVPQRVMDRMIARFDHDPLAVLSQFRKRCGIPIDADRASRLQAGPLKNDLSALANWDLRHVLAGLECPMLSLASTDDPIVSQATSEQAFAACAEQHWHPAGGHVLALSDAAWCAARLMDFISPIEHNS